jgi:hypothetical protein
MDWLAVEPGVWRSTDGRYAIVAHVLPENPPRTVYQARKIDQETARAFPGRGALGALLDELPWCWLAQNDLFSAEAVIERDAFADAHSASVPPDYPAIAIRRFVWPISRGTTWGALVVTEKDGELVAQLIGMSREDDSGFTPGPYTGISLTRIGLAPRPGTVLTTTTDHGPAPCHICDAGIGEPHDPTCSIAQCLVTGQQRLLCTHFGGSLAAGMEALTTGRQGEFNAYFKAPAGHDCGQDTWQGEPAE